MKITFTKHAETMLLERGIDREWIQRTVNAPEARVLTAFFDRNHSK